MTRAPLALVLLLALALRLLYQWEARADLFFTRLIIDAEFYDAWAVRIAGGDWLGSGVFYQDPLYAYFLSACYGAFGRSLAAVRVLQALLDTATVALVFATGRTLFGARAGLLAAAAAAVYGPLVCYTGLLDKTTFTVFLTAASLWLLIESEGRDSSRFRAAAGLVLGACVLTRGNMLLIAAALAFRMLLQGWRRGEGARSLRRPLQLGFGVALAVGCVTLRNAVIGRDPVLLTSNAGLNFFIGNNPNTAGNYLEPPFLHGIPEMEYEDSKRVAEGVLRRPLEKPSQVSAFWFGQGLEFIRGRPGAWLALLSRKAALLLHGFEIPETYSLYYFKERSAARRAAAASYWLVLPLGLAGVFLSRGVAGRAPLLLFGGVYAGSLLLFFITSRYRLPLLVGLLPFAGKALDELYARLRTVSPGRWRLPLLLAVAWAATLWTPEWMARRVVAPGLGTPYGIQGQLLLDLGQPEAAIAALERSLALDPNTALTHAGLATAYRAKGDARRAIGAYERALRLNPFFYEAYNNLASAHYSLGERGKALEYLRAAHRLQPEEREIAENLRRLESELQRK